MNLTSIRRIIFISILIVCDKNALGQGAWDINYLPIDSVNQTFLGKEVRIDFKSSPFDTLGTEINVRRLLVKNDTVRLDFDGEKNYFIECWKIHVDHGIVADQTLEGFKEKENKRVIIKEVFVKAIAESTITFEMYVYYPDISKSHVERKNVVISKSGIKGVLMKIAPSGKDPEQKVYVRDAATAIKIADAIWFSIYGKGIYKCRPFTATLTAEKIWVVRGTPKKNMFGGVPYAEIQQSDCRVLKVTHGK